eukprot:3806423-Alexandrium_andersonii.AAC.1
MPGGVAGPRALQSPKCRPPGARGPSSRVCGICRGSWRARVGPLAALIPLIEPPSFPLMLECPSVCS